MIDPYDPPHPDGPVDQYDPDELPGSPLADVTWLHDDEPEDDERISDFRPHLEDPP